MTQLQKVELIYYELNKAKEKFRASATDRRFSKEYRKQCDEAVEVIIERMVLLDGERQAILARMKGKKKC